MRLLRKLRRLLCRHEFKDIPPLAFLPRRVCRKCDMEQRLTDRHGWTTIKELR